MPSRAPPHAVGPSCQDVVLDVRTLEARIAACVAGGIGRSRSSPVPASASARTLAWVRKPCASFTIFSSFDLPPAAVDVARLVEALAAGQLAGEGLNRPGSRPGSALSFAP